MIFSASPLIKMLFLFSFSFTTLLVFSGLLVALVQHQFFGAITNRKTSNRVSPKDGTDKTDFRSSALHSIALHTPSSSELSSDEYASDKVSFLSAIALLISLGCSLIFTTFFFAQYMDLFVLFAIAICLFLAEKKTALFSFYFMHEKLPFKLSVWSLMVAALCLVISFFYFSDGSLFVNYFPFWADRLLGACLLFCFVLLCESFSSKRFGLHVSFGAVALTIIVSFIGFKLATYWLELAFVFIGLSCSALYWVICVGPYDIVKSIRLALGFSLGVFLLQLMQLGAIYPPLILLFTGLVYVLYPFYKTVAHFVRDAFP